MSTELNRNAPKGNPPIHVAIIMDGNGRWAKERGKPRIFGHNEGAKKIREVVSAANKAGVKFLTLYAFSSENWNRPKDEVNALMGLLMTSIVEYGKELEQNKVRFMTIGDISALPEDCVKAISNLKEKTKNLKNGTLVLALNYGSRVEITKAVTVIARKAASGQINPADISWNTIAEHLDTAQIPDPDLIIRTSGEQRLSNYLLLQSAYSELYFTDVYWPDFGENEFLKAIDDYKNRERRYGKTADQL